MANIRFHHVEKVYPDGTRAVRDFDLVIPDGELLVLVGPSGCGKSTALRMLAGLEDVTSGEIRLGDRRVDPLPPQQRNIAMVFQNYALYPHMTVRQNLEFPLKMMKTPREERNRRVREAARTLSIEALLDRKPKNLSGGQRQRVAMGRALVREPQAFLMDEPLSNLDAKLRVQMRAEIASLQQRLGTTTLYVTHDQVEALTLGDRIAVLKAGELQQVGTPQEIFACPANVFVAAFLGSPSMNLFRGHLEDTADGGEGGGAPTLRAGAVSLVLTDETLRRLPALAERTGEELIFGLRPEAFVPADEVPESRRLTARIEAVEALGHEVIAYLAVEVPPAPVDDARDLAPAVPAGVEPGSGEASAAEGPRTVLATRLPPVFDLEPGDQLTVGVDTGRLYAFGMDGRAL
jgi:multiple sugar transport system ATP-binding protein